MAFSHLPFSSILLLLLLLLLSRPTPTAQSDSPPDHAKPWPEQFHALVIMNFTTTGVLYVTHNYYDWPNRRNINIMQPQFGDVLYDVEWDNGTSFYFTMGASRTCVVKHFPVGITRPDFLSSGSTYLGRQQTNGAFLCDVWQKLDFIWYYEDVATRRPLRWDFFDGIDTHVMTFEEGVVLEDSKWQAPAHCFNGEQTEGSEVPLTRRFHWDM